MESSSGLPAVGALIAGAHAIKPFLEKIFGPSADEVGEWLRLRVHGYLATNTTAALQRAEEMVLAAGEQPRTIPLRTIIPLLEGAAREDNPELREQWAALLARAAIAGDDETIPPIFAGILSQITPAAAIGLTVLSNTQPESYGRRIYNGRLQGGTELKAFTSKLRRLLNQLSEDDASAILDVLVRQQLATRMTVIGPSFSGPGERVTYRPDVQEIQSYDVRITALGQRFLRACTPPQREAPQSDGTLASAFDS